VCSSDLLITAEELLFRADDKAQMRSFLKS
jgi:hypothetical protein